MTSGSSGIGGESSIGSMMGRVVVVDVVVLAFLHFAFLGQSQIDLSCSYVL